MEADLGVDALWVRDQVHEILRAADPGGWRADKAEELRRRVRALVAVVRERRTQNAAPEPSSARFAERLRSLAATMERALPAEPTRSRWAAFVGEVHPEYEALVAALPPGAGAASANANHRPTNHARSLFHLASAAVGFASVATFPSRAVQLSIAGAFVTYAWSMEIARRASPAFNARIMRMYARGRARARVVPRELGHLVCDGARDARGVRQPAWDASRRSPCSVSPTPSRR